MSGDPIRLARSNKRRAQRFREDSDYDTAIILMVKGIETLEKAHREEDGGGQYEIELAIELAEMYGSLGGIYRSADLFLDSYKAYDRGYLYEGNQKYKIVDSYNLTQRLVMRILFQPGSYASELWEIDGVTFPGSFIEAAETIKGQLEGSRKNDHWAISDLAVLYLLLESKEEESAWIRLENTDPKPAPYVFSSNSRALADLEARVASELETSDSDRLRRLHHRLDKAITWNNDRALM